MRSRFGATNPVSSTTSLAQSWSKSSTKDSASSGDVRASPIQSAIVCAISSGCCPPSVRVRTVSFVEELAAAEIGATFNFYREGPRARLLRRRLEGYLASREHARFLLVGEAPG